MVISDDSFASVYAVVEEGRTAFRNIRMATFCLLSTGAADVFIILSALGFGGRCLCYRPSCCGSTSSPTASPTSRSLSSPVTRRCTGGLPAAG